MAGAESELLKAGNEGTRERVTSKAASDFIHNARSFLGARRLAPFSTGVPIEDARLISTAATLPRIIGFCATVGVKTNKRNEWPPRTAGAGNSI